MKIIILIKIEIICLKNKCSNIFNVQDNVKIVNRNWKKTSRFIKNKKVNIYEKITQCFVTNRNSEYRTILLKYLPKQKTCTHITDIFTKTAFCMKKDLWETSEKQLCRLPRFVPSLVRHNLLFSLFLYSRFHSYPR